MSGSLGSSNGFGAASNSGLQRSQTSYDNAIDSMLANHESHVVESFSITREDEPAERYSAILLMFVVVVDRSPIFLRFRGCFVARQLTSLCQFNLSFGDSRVDLFLDLLMERFRAHN